MLTPTQTSNTSLLKAARLLKQRKIKLVTPTVISKLFGIEKQNTVYKLLLRLEKAQIVSKVKQGVYVTNDMSLTSFEIANLINTGSYISFESALNYYSILPQFPFRVTSATTKRSSVIDFNEKTFEYTKINSNYYWGFEKDSDFIIALAEKALLDTLYLSTKGIRNIDVDELDLSIINTDILKEYLYKFNSKPLENRIEKLNII